jgi:hypothetical protein
VAKLFILNAHRIRARVRKIRREEFTKLLSVFGVQQANSIGRSPC